MKIIIPMAGIGKRMRPHTLTVPKPLLKIAGKSIVERLVDNLSRNKSIDEIHYIVGNFGKDVEDTLIELAKEKGARGYIHYQKEALGTAHAIYCASNTLKNDVIIAFADTLFIGDFEINNNDEAIIWTKTVTHPELYGVVHENNKGEVIDFYEKPKNFVSDKAIIGIYYFKNGEVLEKEINRLLNKKIMVNGEFQLTDALKNLLNKGIKFTCKVIDEWLDCGNKEEYLRSSKRILEVLKYKITEDQGKNRINKPVFIGENVIIKDSEIGPNVCIEENSIVENSKLKNSIIGSNTKIVLSDLNNSIVGDECFIRKGNGELNLGAYNQYEGK